MKKLERTSLPAVFGFAALTAGLFLAPGLYAQDTQAPAAPAAGAAATSAAAPAARGGGRGRGQAAPRTPDPREGLAPGLYDAGTALRGMEVVESLHRPDSFQPAAGAPAGRGGPSFTDSDLAFQGHYVIQGNYYGLLFWDVSDPAHTKLATAIVCPGGQGDVSVYGHLAFMSVEQNGRIDCSMPPAPAARGGAAAPGAAPAAPVPGSPALAPGGTAAAGAAPAAARGGRGQVADPNRFRGVRIFDISDLAHPKQVAAVQTCRGSHTHTVVPDPKDKSVLYVYNQGIAGVRPDAELKGCVADPNDPNTSSFSIDVIKVPLAHPEQAAIVNRPRIFADSEGNINGLFPGGTHLGSTERRSATDSCHDITAYPYLGLAAGACAGNGIILDISSPANPKRIEDVSDPDFSYWHSATWNNDGTKVTFGDEWGGGGLPKCRAQDPPTWGADAIFNYTNGRLKMAGYYKMLAIQTDFENCVAHNGNLIPVPGRDIEVQAWYQGGASAYDFTDPYHAKEIAYFDRGPIDGTRAVDGGFWSVYYWNGYIYGSEIARGFDVLKLTPTADLSQNEIDAAALVHFDEMNPQSQPHIVWPASFVVARAYLDQLVRDNSLSKDRADALDAAMKAVEGAAPGAARKTAETQLEALTAQLTKDAATAKTVDAKRMRECVSTIQKRDAALK